MESDEGDEKTEKKERDQWEKSRRRAESGEWGIMGDQWQVDIILERIEGSGLPAHTAVVQGIEIGSDIVDEQFQSIFLS